jgi:hypothetical protein
LGYFVVERTALELIVNVLRQNRDGERRKFIPAPANSKRYAARYQ